MLDNKNSNCGLVSAGYILMVWGAGCAICVYLNLFPEMWMSAGYEKIAFNIIEGEGYSLDGKTPTGFRPPLYPLLISLLGVVLGESWRAGLFMLHVVLASGCAYFTYNIGQNIFGDKRISMIGVLLLSLDPVFFGELLLVRETALFTFLTVYFFDLATREGGFKEDLSMAMVAGLSNLVRPTGIILIFVFVFYIFYRKIVSIKDVYCIFLVFIVCFPWYLFMYSVIGHRGVSSSTTGGLNLYKGNNSIAYSTYLFVDVDKQENYIRDRFSLKDSEPWSKINASLKRNALTFMAYNPVKTLDMSMRKIFALYSPVPIPMGEGKIKRSEKKYHISNYTPVRSIEYISHALYALVVLTGLIGILLSLSDIGQTGKIVPIVAFIILLTLLHSVTFSEPRFRIPVDPVISLFSSYFTIKYLRSF